MSYDQIFFSLVIGCLFLVILSALVKSIRLVPAQSEFIVERLGRYHKTLKAGFHLLFPFIDKVAYIQDLKEHTRNVPPQQCFTKDEIQVEVDGIIYMQVFDTVKASYGITDYRYGAVQLAQTTTRAIIGTLELDKTFEEREAISGKVVEVLDGAAHKWGVKILRFEIMNLTPPESVRLSMEMQVTAERNRRAILQKSTGEKQSLINTSEGKKAELINISEGEKIKMINEAEGAAQEILQMGTATAESIRKIASVINGPGGKNAVSLELGLKYFETLGKLKGVNKKIILAGNLANMNEMLKAMDLEIK
jgi:regulator of protease activity HflC (stomatin/prohibitin superfamily)